MRYVMIQILFAFSIVSTKAQKQTWLEHSSMSLCVNYTEFNVCLPRYITTGGFIYDTLPEAQKACEAHSQCTGVTHEPNNNRYTLRRGITLHKSKNGETSWTVDSEIIISKKCDFIGLRANNNKFLSVEHNGVVRAFRSGYSTSNGKIYPHINLKGRVELGSNFNGGQFTPYKDGKIDCKRTPWTNSLIFDIYRKGNKIGFKSIYGKFLSVSNTGTVTFDSQSFGKNEEFEVYPLECLKQDDCTQDLPISVEKWKLFKVDYDTDRSLIYEYAPSRVTMQHIDNTGGSREQGSSFTASRTLAGSISYSHTAGVGIAVGTEFKAGIPLIGEAKASVQLTADYQFSYGKERTIQTTYSSQYDCVAPPGRNIECIAYLQKIKMTVPYNMTWISKRNYECERYVVGTLTAIKGEKMMMRVYEYE